MNRWVSQWGLRAKTAGILAVLLSLSLMPTAAFAQGAHPLAEEGVQAGDVSGEPVEAAEPVESVELIEPTEPAETAERAVPSSYYLTNEGAVTPVKLQSPWGSCWAFAIASALESSILKAQMSQDLQTVEHATPKLIGLNDTVDISERAIAWLAHEQQTEASAGGQAGEGYYLLDPGDKLAQLSAGNFAIVEAMLAAGQSLIDEESAPYRYEGYAGSPFWFSTGSAADAANDARMFDWSIDDAFRVDGQMDWRVTNILELPSPAQLSLDPENGTGEYIGYDPAATLAIKQTLMDVGAVAVALETDSTLPQEVTAGQFESASPSKHLTYTTWSQFNGALQVMPDHAVAIVGWDDTYDPSNFAGTESGQPFGPGAWLCKNNWGSDALYAGEGASEEASHWGLHVDAGSGPEATGFFWVSYYDHTLSDPVAFEVAPAAEASDNLYQYDYLGASEFQEPSRIEGDARVANVFTAQNVELLEAVTSWTFEADETVEVQVFLLPDDVQIDNEEVDADDIFGDLDPVIELTERFEYAGFHTIDLVQPLLLMKGQRFAVVQRVCTTRTNASGEIKEASYLNLELAFLQNVEEAPQPSMAHVVAHDGETFILLPGGSWVTLAEYNAWLADLKAQDGKPVDVEYGNALIKAMTQNTSMGSESRVYQTVALEERE